MTVYQLCKYLHNRQIAIGVFRYHQKYLQATPGNKHNLRHPTPKRKIQHCHLGMEPLTPGQKYLDKFQNNSQEISP